MHSSRSTWSQHHCRARLVGLAELWHGEHGLRLAAALAPSAAGEGAAGPGWLLERFGSATRVQIAAQLGLTRRVH